MYQDTGISYKLLLS